MEEQLYRISNVQKTTGIMLQNNKDFHDWIMMNSRMQMPMRLELFYSNLNKNNMKRRLFYIYKWNVGRSDATRAGYAEWLK